MKEECSVIGFYVSQHPMDMYENALKSIHAVPSDEIRGVTEDKRIIVAGIVESVRSRIARSGNRFHIITISDARGSTEILFSERGMAAGRNRELINGENPVAISCDAKVNGERISLFGSAVEELALNTKISGAVNITVREEEAVAALRKTLASIGPGYTSVNLIVADGGKRASVRLAERYNITTETIESFKEISGVEVGF
jgi:DNA polymerase-3 subunit alpha